ncbi:hypothetical protein [Malacoplasma muris]|uniref:hypothetical protein n=1 Tax=Malacoplasma muris TaxID=2119 RepID=UPI00398E552C
MNEITIWFCYILALLLILLHFGYVFFTNNRMKCFKTIIFKDNNNKFNNFCIKNWLRIIKRDKFYYFFFNYLMLSFYIVLFSIVIYFIIQVLFSINNWYATQKWPEILIITITVVYYFIVLVVFSIFLFKFWSWYKNVENCKSNTKEKELEDHSNNLLDIKNLSNLLDIRTNDTIIDRFILLMNKKNNKFFNRKKKNIYFYLNYLMWRYSFMYAYMFHERDLSGMYIFLGVIIFYNNNKVPILDENKGYSMIVNKDEFMTIIEDNIIDTYYKWEKINN